MATASSTPTSHIAAAAGTTPVVLRATTPSIGQVSVDALGPGRLLVKPDGIVWEVTKPEDTKTGVLSALGSLAKSGAEVAMTVSGCVALYTTASAIDHSLRNGYCLTSGQLARMVASAVSSCLAGTATGWVYGPVLAARHLMGRLFRPVLVAASLAQATRMGLGLLRSRLPNVLDIIHILQNGTAEQQVAAAGQLLRHAGSSRFSRRFTRVNGMHLLVSMLHPAAAAPPDPAVGSLLIQALAKLLRCQTSCRAFVEAGGVPALLAVLPAPAQAPPSPSSPATTAPGTPDPEPNFVFVVEAAAATPAPAPPPPAAAAAAASAPGAVRPGADVLAALEALRLLLGDAECKETAVEAGAPARLVGLLRGSNVPLLRAALGALHAAADHPLARVAIRSAGGVPRLMELLQSVAHALVRVLVLRVLAHLSLEPVVLQEVAQAGGIPLAMQLLRQQALAVRGTPRRPLHFVRLGRGQASDDVSGPVLELLALLAASSPSWREQLRSQALAWDVICALEPEHSGSRHDSKGSAYWRVREMLRA